MKIAAEVYYVKSMGTKVMTQHFCDAFVPPLVWHTSSHFLFLLIQHVMWIWKLNHVNNRSMTGTTWKYATRYTFLTWGSSGPRSFLNEEGRFRPWSLHRQLHWRTRSQVRQIYELHIISWVLACWTNAIHCRHLSQRCIHVEQCNTISALYYD